MKDNSDLFFGDERNRPKPHIPDDEEIESLEIVETSVSATTTTKVTTEETTTSTTTTTTDEPTTTTEIKTTTSTTTVIIKDDHYKEHIAEELSRESKPVPEDTQEDSKEKVENSVQLDDTEVQGENDRTLQDLLEEEIHDPSVLLVGKDKSECSSLVLIFHQLKFNFEENYTNLDRFLSTNVPAIIFCSYSAYFNFKNSSNFQQLEHTPTLLFPYFSEPAQFEIGNTGLEVVNVVQDSTYEFLTADSKFNRIAKVSQVIHCAYLTSPNFDFKEPIEIDLERISYLSTANQEATISSGATILSSVHINDANKPIILAYENSHIFTMEPGMV